MSVVHCDVLLNNQKSIYEPGDELTGRVILVLDVRLLVKAIFIKYTGFAEVQWQNMKKLKNSKKNAKDQLNSEEEKQQLEVYTNREEFQSTIHYFLGSEEAIPRIIDQGTYTYQFSVTLPKHCPSSFESPYGHVRYMLQVFIEYKNKLDLKFMQKLNVLQSLDLRNYKQQIKTAQSSDLCTEEDLGFFQTFKEPLKMLVNLQSTAFIPGEIISIHTFIYNPDKLKLNELSYELFQISCITATHGHKKTKTKQFFKTLFKEVHQFCNANDVMLQHLQTLRLSQTVPTTDAIDCRCLQISYELIIRLGTNNTKRWLEAKIPLIVGTISRLQAIEMVENLNLNDDHCQRKLSTISMDNLDSTESRNNFASPTAPPMEARNRSMSLTSLASSSFREAEYMPKSKFNAESKKTKHHNEYDNFKPKYLYYEMNNATTKLSAHNEGVIAASAPEIDDHAGR